MVDASGQEWFVDNARKEGCASPLYRLLPRRYRTVATGVDHAGDPLHAAACREPR